MKYLSKTIFIGLVASALLVGCEGTDGGDDGDGGGSGSETMGLTLQPSALPNVGDNYQWEGWLATEEGPQTTGKFTQEDGKESYTFEVDSSVANNAKKFILTLEPKPDDDPAPSDWKFLAGEVSENTATANFTTKPAPGANLGGYFDGVTGKYFLKAPSSSTEDDDTQGIWFIDNSGDEMAAGLSLPKLPSDGPWVYEGWVVKDQPVTTGQFADPGARDADGAGPTAGDDGDGPPFPGQDFVKEDGRMLASGDYKAVISLEPNDDVAAPFAVKPLVGSISADTQVGTVQTMENKIDTPPSVAVTLAPMN